MKRALALALLLLVFALLVPKLTMEETEAGGILSVEKQEFTEAEDLKLEVSAEDFRKSILRICSDAVLEEDPSEWLGQAKRGESVIVGGREISAMTLSQIFLLGSRDFQLSWTGENFLFEVNNVDKTYSEA